MKVAKFGGSSVADAKQILKVVEIIKADPDRRIVVVSAPGKRFSRDIKVTDLLIALADAVIAGRPYEQELAVVVGRYAEIQRELGLTPPSSARSSPICGIASLVVPATTPNSWIRSRRR